MIIASVIRELETRRKCSSFHSMSEIPIPAEAVVLARLCPATYRVALPNGKEIVGHVPKERRDSPPDYAIGDRLLLEMTPYDFSKGRIAKRLEGTAASDAQAP